MRLRAMRLLHAIAAAMTVLALGACGSITPLSTSSPTPSPPPQADLKVGSPDDRGIFYMRTGQTLLLAMLNHASSGDKAVLAVAGQFANATLFAAGAAGRTTVTAYYIGPDCKYECNAHAPFTIAVVVVSEADLNQGVVVSEKDLPWIIHLRSGQPFVVALQNRPGSPPWARVTGADQKVIVADGQAVVSADGIRGRFRAGDPGRSGIEAAGPNCPPGAACPQGPLADFTVQVFS
jgi:hypothetical protein